MMAMTMMAMMAVAMMTLGSDAVDDADGNGDDDNDARTMLTM